MSDGSLGSLHRWRSQRIAKCQSCELQDTLALFRAVEHLTYWTNISHCRILHCFSNVCSALGWECVFFSHWLYSLNIFIQLLYVVFVFFFYFFFIIILYYNIIIIEGTKKKASPAYFIFFLLLLTEYFYFFKHFNCFFFFFTVIVFNFYLNKNSKPNEGQLFLLLFSFF